MPHETPLIATIVVGLVVAFIFGAIANRLRVPPLVGYLLAGVLAGSHTPGFVADQELAAELAEIGVILLMFGVGLHFSLKDLLSVRAIAIPGAIVQIVVATLLGAGLAWILGWSMQAGFVFGLALSVASTVVLLRAMQERRLIETERGRIAVGWLIVEDLAMVLALVLLPAIADAVNGKNPAVEAAAHIASDPIVAYFNLGIGGIIGLTLGKVAAFVAVMLIVGRRVIPWTLHAIAHTGSRELFRLAVLAIALGVAFGASKLFGVSLALGAFFAGMIMSESELSHRAAEESLPLRDAFAVLFFVSVGMLFDPMTIINDPLPLLATLAIIVVGKSLAAFFIVLAFGYPTGTALIISASLAQIGEFSFILAELGVGLGMLPQEGRDLILGGAILSILLNPVVFAGVGYLKPWLEKRSASATEASPETTVVEEPDVEELQPTTLTNHAVLIP
uniref:cation:proton antiporter domain-containing protein n=1 Tax=uncultured Methylobacterium sp. TaxID=157278 RepID=UPI0025924C4D